MVACCRISAVGFGRKLVLRYERPLSTNTLQISCLFLPTVLGLPPLWLMWVSAWDPFDWWRGRLPALRSVLPTQAELQCDQLPLSGLPINFGSVTNSSWLNYFGGLGTDLMGWSWNSVGVGWYRISQSFGGLGMPSASVSVAQGVHYSCCRISAEKWDRKLWFI